ncbi:MAG: hypothetical protein ACUVYA_04010 [Planctomycetota bacterium]
MRERRKTGLFLAAAVYLAASALPLAHAPLARSGCACAHGPLMAEVADGTRGAPAVSNAPARLGWIHDPRTCLLCVAAAAGGLAALEPDRGAFEAAAESSPEIAAEPSARVTSLRDLVSHPARGPPPVS